MHISQKSPQKEVKYFITIQFQCREADRPLGTPADAAVCWP